jgi:integrase
MAKKTNCVINGNAYFRKYATINGKRQMVYADCEKNWKIKVDEMKRLEARGIIFTKSKLGEALKTWVYDILPRDTKRRNVVSYGIYEGIYRNQIAIDKKSLMKARNKIRCFDKIDELSNNSASLMDVRLIDVKSSHLQKYLSGMAASGATISMMENSKKVLNLFFDYCVGEGLIERNPCKNAHIPNPEEKEGGSVAMKDEDGDTIEIFSDKEIAKINSALQGRRIRFLVVLGLATGMRQGEMLALKHEDFSSNSIYVNKSQKTLRNIKEGEPTVYEIIDGAPKSRAGYRHIPIEDWVMKEYEIHRKLCQEEKLSWGKGRLSDNDHIFLSPTGLRCQGGQLQKEWKEILLIAGVEYRKFHTLRHTCITKWVQVPNVNIVAIKDLAGHAKLETTLKYTHIEASNKIEIINASAMNMIFK